MKVLWLTAASVTGLLLACNVRSSARPPIDTSICSIARTPESFDGRSVTVPALLVSTGRDGARLIDPACPSTAVLLVPRGGRIDRSVSDLALALTRGGRAPTTSDREVSAKFTGILRFSSDSVRRRTFELTSVRDFKITPKG